MLQNNLDMPIYRVTILVWVKKNYTYLVIVLGLKQKIVIFIFIPISVF